MTTAPNPKLVREIAEDAMRGAIADGMFWHVNQAVGNHGVPGLVFKGSTFEVHRTAAIAEYKRMADALDRPDGQPEEERDAQLADLATELDAANDNADEIAKQRSEYREEIMRLRAERDEARELACVSLDILKNVSDEPMRELFGVDDFGEMPEWFTGYGKPSTGALDAHNANGGE